ncbi:MAG TPA: B12-binding domain-containing radical SAM protein [bacterium]|nr:B12-binding domain-containing radical SAM protein [bacterium]
MNILLIYPKFPDTFWSYRHALKFIRKKAYAPPLGLLTIAPMLPASWENRLLDLNITSLTQEDLAWADFAFISGMVVQREAAKGIIDRCKQAGVTTVVGGPLFTSEYQDFDQVDHFVLDEAEITLPRFLSDLSAGRARRVYRAAAHPELRNTPVPAWDLVNMREYSTMSIQYSRGCPYHCEFCNVTALFGHRPRIKSAAQVIRELTALYDQGWRGSIFFVDDNFIGHRKHLRTELLPALIEWRRTHKEVKFHTEVSINLADDESLMAMMADAGFTTIFVGIETPDDQSLVEACKQHNRNRDLTEDVKRLHRAGLQVQGGFIVGFDNDTPSIFQRQINFIQQSGVVVAMVGLLQAPIGTKLYDRLKKASRILGTISGDNVDGTTNIIPKMGLETLQKGYRTILQTIYAPANYYPRVKTFLKDYTPSWSTMSIKWEHIMAFLRSIYHLGIRGKERKQYWHLLGWTIFTHPRLFPVAITMAIYGHHFRKITETRLL